MLALSDACLNGTDGAPLDIQNGLDWCQKAAAAGNKKAAVRYALIQFYGAYGVKQDDKMFQFWASKSQNPLFKAWRQLALASLVFAQDHDGMSPGRFKDLSDYGGGNDSEAQQNLEPYVTFYPQNIEQLSSELKSRTVIIAIHDPLIATGFVLFMANGAVQGVNGKTIDQAASQKGFSLHKWVLK